MSILSVSQSPPTSPSGPRHRQGVPRRATVWQLAKPVGGGFGVVVAAGWAGAGTWLVMAATEKAFQGARINRDVENRGLDRSQHGESSYQDLTSLL